MDGLLLLNAAEPEETRAVLLEQGRVVEYRRERANAATLVGNVYHGTVVNLEAGIGAAFVNIGVGRNGFLHVSDLPAEEGRAETDRIGDRVAVGDRLLVQVTRDPIGSKGPVLTAEISLPGRFLVLLPLTGGGGISRRIEEADERGKLRELAKELEPLAGGGLIFRTASAERSREDLLADLRALRRLWEDIQARAAGAAAPALLHAEGDLVRRVLRDLVDDDVAEIHVDTPEALSRGAEVLRTIDEDLVGRLRLHEGALPLFHAFDVETQIDRLRARRVPLPGGGSVVFDATEALVAVDVNSGRTRHEEGLEETALQANLEAAEEIARQLRLRDLGGVVVVDFIDMRDAEHVQEVERRFREHLRRDRARLRPGRMGAFGIFVLTRQRASAGAGDGRLPCPHCGGTGEVVRPEEVALRVFRELLARAGRAEEGALRVRLSPEVAETLRAMRQPALRALGEETGRPLLLEADPDLPPGGWRIDLVRAP